MSWLTFSLLTALFESLKDLSVKISLQQNHRYVVTWAAGLFSLPPILCLAANEPFPEISATLIFALFAAATLHIAALLLYIHALSLAPMSLTLPIISFTPAFMLLTSPIMIGEAPSAQGGLGVLTIVAGTFLLSGGSKDVGWLEPMRALWREKGVQLMMLVAFLWSLSGNFDRIGLNNSGPFWWLFFLMFAITLGLTGNLIFRRSSFTVTSKHIFSRATVLVGFLNALSMITYMIAIGGGIIAYVVSIKRLSIFLGICWGFFFLNEKSIRQRLLGSAVMFIGLLIVSFG